MRFGPEHDDEDVTADEYEGTEDAAGEVLGVTGLGASFVGVMTKSSS